MRMSSNRFQSGEVVMGRWPGSSLFYEVRVLRYDAQAQLYTVIYKDGTELQLRQADMKSTTGFQQGSGRSRSRSRSRSPSRRRSRSRSPARTTRRSSSRTTESRSKDKLRDMLEVRLTPVAMPVENNSNNKHEKTEANDAAHATNQKTEEVPDSQAGGGRYNLRRRKDQGDARPVEPENKEAEPPVTVAPLTVAPASRAVQLEFGGRMGVLFWMVVLPVLALAVLVLCARQDASLQAVGQACTELAQGEGLAATLWDWQVFGLLLLWLLLQALLAILPVGKVVEGMPLPNGKRLLYRINGFYALLVSAAAMGVAVYQGVDLSYIHTHFLQFYSAALLVSVLLSVFLFVRARWAPKDELAPAGNTGSVLYDFFMGRELNPRIRGFDVKFFCEMRPGLIGWLVINFSMLLAEMKQQQLQTPSTAMILVNVLQLVWVTDGLWHEEKLLTMMDITYDGFGFMLAFGDLVWVPFTFTSQAHYLVAHPSDLSALWTATILTMNGVGYYIFRKANSQKFAFRKNPSDPKLSYLKTIPTATGKSLLVSGLWGFVRHPNYLGDLLMGVAWSLACGFTHAAPYFYPLYLTLLLLHRQRRDDRLCHRKYGSAWDEYCRSVKYRILPGIY